MASGTSWSIRVLEYARAPVCPASVLVYGAVGMRPLPYSITVLQSADRTVLVDTGYDDSGYGHELGEIDGITVWTPPIEVLARVDLRPEDVDVIVLTHAHYDHLGNIERFPNAVGWIQQRELDRWSWALGLPDRFGWLKDGVDRDDLTAAQDLIKEGRLHVVDGETLDILPGLHLATDFDTHTFGHQHVVLEDEATGTWVLPGDAVYAYDNLGGLDGRGRITPIGYGTGSQENSLFALAAMLDAVRGDPRRIVPGHEAGVFEEFPSRRFEDGLMAAEILVRPGDERRWPDGRA